jgi:hypothetical protein
MAIKILECTNIADGCKVRFVPDADNAASYLAERCAERGWKAGEPTIAVEGTPMQFIFVDGATSAEFRKHLEADSQFDFSRCKPQ